jgi:hypothetical protein
VLGNHDEVDPDVLLPEVLFEHRRQFIVFIE